MQKITEYEEQQRVKRCQKSEAEILKPSKNEEDGKQNVQESEAEIEKSKEMEEEDDSESTFSAESHTYYDSDKDPPYIPEFITECEVSDCPGEVFSACHICNQLLCYTHFRNTVPCEDDHKFVHQEHNSRNKKTDTACTSMKNLVPEDFIVDGSKKEEGAQPRIAKRN